MQTQMNQPHWRWLLFSFIADGMHAKEANKCQNVFWILKKLYKKIQNVIYYKYVELDRCGFSYVVFHEN